MDKIILNNLSFYGYHGVLEEENKLGQNFIFDVELYLDLKKSGISDDLTKSVSYAEVFFTIKKIVEGKPFKLIEALAEKITSDILEKYNLVKTVKVLVKKPEAPVPGSFNYFGVEIVRSRVE